MWKALYSTLAQHALLTAKEENQSKEEPETVTNKDKNRKMTAPEALKKFDEGKNFIEPMEANMIFNELVENVQQMKLKYKKTKW